MKKITCIMMSLLFIILLLPFGVFAETDDMSWDKTVDTSWYYTHEDDEIYNINTASQLAGLAELVNNNIQNFNNKTINLTADMSLNSNSESYIYWDTTVPSNEWTPIGRCDAVSGKDYYFQGTFNGNNHTVSGIYINQPDNSYQGLFGNVKGKIENVVVANSYIKGKNFVGGICGYNVYSLKNCYNSGSIYGTDYIGGVCGYCFRTVVNCYNSGNVGGSNYIGGVCGKIDRTLGACYNTGAVQGSSEVGGICGRGSYTCCCYNTGTVQGSSYVGGVCGNAQKSLNDSYSVGTVSGTTYVGGVCGFNDSAEINNCYYNKEVTPIPSKAVGNVYTTTATLKGLTTTEMKSQTFFHTLGYHFKFDINENTGYPVLDTIKTLSDADDLKVFRDIVNSGDTCLGITFNLTSDIDLNPGIEFTEAGPTSESIPQEWTAIGNSDSAFTGTFNGNGHTVSGVYINKPSEDYQGFFAYNQGTIINLGIVNSYIQGKDYVGGICSYYNSQEFISNCYNSGYVLGNTNVGGILGNLSYYFSLWDCYNDGYVFGDTNVGGVCGYNLNGTIKNCYNTGEVSGNDKIGSVCGENSGTIENCYYLDSSETDGNNGTTFKTSEQFQSGEVAYLLNRGINDGTQSFYQNIDNATTDKAPIFDKSHGTVFYNKNQDPLYSNTDRSEIISIDILWGSMEFTYGGETWNVENHKWENGSWTCDQDADKLTVTNNGNVSVTATLSYAKTESAFNVNFKDSDEAPISSLSLESSDTKSAYIVVMGIPTDDLDKRQIGTVTVLIN